MSGFGVGGEGCCFGDCGFFFFGFDVGCGGGEIFF